jgi:hypothetical protein
MDDDGGVATPDNLQDLMLTPADSNRMEIRPADAPAIKTAVVRTFGSDRIGAVLIANGFSSESASRVEDAAKALFNFQSLPPNGGAIAVGSLSTTGDYRVTQFVIYQGDDYIGAVALGEGGRYFEGARPAAAPSLLEDVGKANALNMRYTLADGLYSAGLRAAMPESVVREAIQLVRSFVDLKAPLMPDETFRALFAKDARGKGKDPGKMIYVSLAGSSGAYDCYVYESESGAFSCFDPKGTAPPPESTKPSSTKEHAPPAEHGAPPPPSPSANSGAQIADLPAPIRGAPISSLFGMRFHPILLYWRLHGGIDFAAPVGSPVRAVDDGKIEIAEPVSGFGNHVRILHKGFETSYSHLSEIPAPIHPGVDVKRGDIIALSGNTGLSTGPHLHFEFYLDRTAVDPFPHMSAEARAGGVMEGPMHFAAAAAHVTTAAELEQFRGFKTQIDAVVAEQTK